MQEVAVLRCAGTTIGRLRGQVVIEAGLYVGTALIIASHVGIAMIDGTALAREVANVLLTRSDLHGILTARQLARGTLKRIHTNFTVTLVLNSLFLVGGLTMLLPPGLSALLHNLTTLGVSLNAMRPHLNRHTHPEQAV